MPPGPGTIVMFFGLTIFSWVLLPALALLGRNRALPAPDQQPRTPRSIEEKAESPRSEV
jgi:hypothetical protein